MSRYVCIRCTSIIWLIFSFRLLYHHNRLLACTSSGCLPFVHECAVPTYRRKDKTDRGCVAFLFHYTHPLTYSGSQVVHSAERTDFLISVFSPYVYHALITPFFPFPLLHGPLRRWYSLGRMHPVLSVRVIFSTQKCSFVNNSAFLPSLPSYPTPLSVWSTLQNVSWAQFQWFMNSAPCDFMLPIHHMHYSLHYMRKMELFTSRSVTVWIVASSLQMVL